MQSGPRTNAQDLRRRGRRDAITTPPADVVRPSFLVIGSAKAATTALCLLLRRHPRIVLPRAKELHFLSYDGRYRRGWRWYDHQLRAGCALDERMLRDARVGEGSTTYSMIDRYPHVPARAVAMNPELRIVYLVRDPLDRARSHWMERRGGAQEERPFNVAMREDPIYWQTSCYWRQLTAWRAVRPDAAIHVERFEDFRDDPNGVLSRVLAFLDLAPLPPFDDAHERRYSSDRKFVDGALLRFVRHAVPSAAAVRRVLPRKLRTRVAPWLKRPIGAPPEWEAETRAWFLGKVADDAAQCCAWAGWSPEEWPALRTEGARDDERRVA